MAWGRNAEEVEGPTPIHFINKTFRVRTDVYGEFVRETREDLGRRQELKSGFAVMPSKKVNGYKNYVRHTLEGRKEKECVIFIRETDQYIVGYETPQGVLYELEPDKKGFSEVDTTFSVYGADGVVTLLFKGKYEILSRAARLQKSDIRIDGKTVLRAVANLSEAVVDGKYRMVARDILTLVVVFCEAVRFYCRYRYTDPIDIPCVRKRVKQ